MGPSEEETHTLWLTEDSLNLLTCPIPTSPVARRQRRCPQGAKKW
jgi:hypothetical protein